jgi:myo-inositol 2-dehydrogenase/D-chiro-inositol 1-dehydrogenase
LILHQDLAWDTLDGMPDPVRVAVAGLGRMGAVHALHVQELAVETQACELVALADLDTARAEQVAQRIGSKAPIYPSLAELGKARCCDAVVLVTPTENHFEHASLLIKAGHRVLMEKPLTGTLEGDRAFAAELEDEHPDALMLAFQRRFDEPLRYAKQLVETGAIGRVFKVYSALEDSGPAPHGYRSGGILPDMSVHNVDEILWLTGETPRSSLSIGTRLYSHALTTADEDFDDALLYLWFDSGAVAQVQVSRNHVSGYRVETIIFGEEGQVHVGRFDQKLRTVTVEAYGRRNRSEPIAFRSFEARDYGEGLPEFVDRFGAAYKAEVAAFVECCRAGKRFPTSHLDGLRAQEVISAGMRCVISSENAAVI